MEEKRQSVIAAWLRNPVTFFTPLLALALFLGLAPCDALLCDLASHFMAQYTLGATGLLAFAFLFRLSPRWKAFLTALLLLAGWQLLAFIPARALPEPAHSLKILQANVLFLNIDPLPLKRLIAAEKPDIVATVETPPEFTHMMQTLKKDYPYQSLHPQGDNPRGIAIMSRLPFTKAEITSFDNSRVPAAEFSVALAGKTVSFLAIHPFTPTENIARRDNEFRLIAERYKKNRPDNLIILGDFNATPYCRAYKSLVSDLHLRNARDGFGIYPTWPVFLPTPLPRIAIDHVLVSDSVLVHDFRTGSAIGSDHLPTLTVISLKD